MSASSPKARILVIRPWTEPLTPLREALHDAGITARIVRVDIEPALNAALARGGHDVIVFDPKTPTITRDVVEARLQEHRRAIPIIAIDELDSVVTAVKRVLADRMN